ncbi:MAG TPA: YkoF family thiamine/hydroxymethylpyrimidine-binding protein [Paracoccaceae bacterium]|nr:YkoF family thiamine/hydroxymethylpyrimidine-binding protein [Paracoccaceae bacterium]
MFTGAQISLYPMTDRFVAVILEAVASLEPWRERLRIETDELSTLIVGPPEDLVPAMRDLFVGAARTGLHVVLAATLSRGCPGSPDDPSCASPRVSGRALPAEERIREALARVREAPLLGQQAVAQAALYPLGTEAHMEEIAACIGFLDLSGLMERPKNFCTKLRGDAGPLFAGIAEAFLSFGAPEAHVTMDLKVSANSPGAR